MSRPALALALALCCLGPAVPALAADTLVAARTIRAAEVIGPQDVTLAQAEAAGALSDPGEVIGQEARVVLYAGRPIRPGDIGPPAIVERNEEITLVFRQGGLAISAAGRALGRGGEGDVVRAMNLASRKTVSGVVGPQGAVHVSGSQRP